MQPLANDAKEVKLSLTLPSRRDEGIMILEIARSLCNAQNEFLTQLAVFPGIVGPPAIRQDRQDAKDGKGDAKDGKDGKDGNRTPAAVPLPPSVSSEHVTAVDMIQVDVKELETFIRAAHNQELRYGASQASSFNCDVIERFIVQMSLAGRSPVAFSVREFEFRDHLIENTDLVSVAILSGVDCLSRP